MRKLRPSEVILWAGRERHTAAQRRRDAYFSRWADQESVGPPRYVSQQLNMMSGLAPIRKPKKRKARMVVDVPPTFSLIHNPEQTLKLVVGFAEDVRRYHPKEVYFNHRNMEKVDLAAECLLDAVATEMAHEYAGAGRKRPVYGGSFPRAPDLERFLRAVGIIKNLDVQHELLKPSQMTKLRVFQRRSRGPGAPVRADTPGLKERVLAEFVQHVNSCLMANGKKLTDRAVLRLLEYAGEILDNAEQHSGTDDWSIFGYLDNAEPGHVFDVAIFNFGKTIAETLAELPRESFAWGEIQKYVAEHSRRSLFENNWTEENLLTLVALQGHISRKTSGPEDDRGQGTVDLINFFQGIHRDCTKAGKGANMAIVSGGTHIRFDGTYAMRPDTRDRQVIAFNEANSLSERPDPRFVSNMAVRFPGTLIGIRFPLQESQTESRE